MKKKYKGNLNETYVFEATDGIQAPAVNLPELHSYHYRLTKTIWPVNAGEKPVPYERISTFTIKEHETMIKNDQKFGTEWYKLAQFDSAELMHDPTLLDPKNPKELLITD